MVILLGGARYAGTATVDKEITRGGSEGWVVYLDLVFILGI